MLYTTSIFDLQAQKNFMGAFEITTGSAFPDQLIPKTAHILKTFYDQDLVEEEVLLEWGSKVWHFHDILTA